MIGIRKESVRYPERAKWDMEIETQPATGKWRGRWYVNWDATYWQNCGSAFRQYVNGKSREEVVAVLGAEKSEYDLYWLTRDAKDLAASLERERLRWERA